MQINADILNAWAGTDYRRWIKLTVARASRKVYEILVKNYNFPFNWSNGNEQMEINETKMVDALIAEADKSGNPLAFARMISSGIPAGDMYRDNRVSNRIEKLLRDNP